VVIEHKLSIGKAGFGKLYAKLRENWHQNGRIVAKKAPK
jgi:hypothetical protein